MSYRVRAGDTLSGIAARSHVSLGTLERANRQVHNPNMIYVGESINIPGQHDSFHPAHAKPPAHHPPAHHPPAHRHSSGGSAPVRAVHQTVGGQVGKWIAQAQAILKAHGLPMSKMNAKDIATIIRFESGGNPKAQNNWDSNARAGHPSIGLMQTIGPTFNAHKLPGHGNIRNPIDNIIAGVRYAISRYGSISNVPGIIAVHHGRRYVGY